MILCQPSNLMHQTLLMVFLLSCGFYVFAPNGFCKVLAADSLQKEEAAPPVGHTGPYRTLAQRIPSVTGQAFTKLHRVVFTPALGLSLTDVFYRYYQPALAFEFYALDWLSLGMQVETYLSEQLQIGNVTGAPQQVTIDYNKPSYAARFLLGFSPLYGKINWFAEKVAHFDTYLTAGVGVLSASVGGGSVGVFSLALGQHYFLSPWLALRLELRDEVYNMARNPQTSTVKTLQNLLGVSVGLSFYLPSQVALSQP